MSADQSSPYRSLENVTDRAELIRRISDMAANYAPGANARTNKDIVSQWVKQVNSYSSQYDNSSWPARCVVGEPSVYPKYGDIAGAWASGDKDAHQFIEVEYEEAVYVTGVDLYETYHAGGVMAVKALNEDRQWTVLWSQNIPQVIKQSRIFKPPISITSFRTKTLRIEVDCTACRSWVEIDAIELHGQRYLSDPPPAMDVLASDLKLMVNNPVFSDCQFLIGEKCTMYAHKAIICSRADYFKAMFVDSTKESMSSEPIPIKGISRDSFMAVLHFLYTNKIPDVPVYDCVMLTDVWRVADRLSIGGLQKLVLYLISIQITEQNVVDTYCAAADSLPIIDEVKKNCMLYISNNLPKIVNTQSFTQLPQEVMLEIIQGCTANLKIK